MKDARVQVTVEKPPRRSSDCPGMVQVISLSKGTEIRGDGIQEYYSSINTFRIQSPDVLGMVQTYRKNNLHPHSSSFRCKRQYLGNGHDNLLFCTNLLTPLAGWPRNAWHLSGASSRLDLETLNWGHPTGDSSQITQDTFSPVFQASGLEEVPCSCQSLNSLLSLRRRICQ